MVVVVVVVVVIVVVVVGVVVAVGVGVAVGVNVAVTDAVAVAVVVVVVVAVGVGVGVVVVGPCRTKVPNGTKEMNNLGAVGLFCPWLSDFNSFTRLGRMGLVEPKVQNGCFETF